MVQGDQLVIPDPVAGGDGAQVRHRGVIIDGGANQLPAMQLPPQSVVQIPSQPSAPPPQIKTVVSVHVMTDEGPSTSSGQRQTQR